MRVWPGHAVGLTLLVVPHAAVNATTGMLPRKEIGVRRQWIADALAKIAPSFRFGPVLVDPKTIRMPIATELRQRLDLEPSPRRHELDRRARHQRHRRRADRRRCGGAEEGWLTLHERPEEPS